MRKYNCTGIAPKGTRNEGTRKKENPRYTSQIDNWSSDKTVDSQEDFTYTRKIVVNSNMNLLVLVELILKVCSWMMSMSP